MTTTVAAILNEAREYIGVEGGSERHHFIIDTYNSVTPLPRGYLVTYENDWCDAFISFLAIRTKSIDLIGRECGVQRHIDIFKQKKIWFEDGTITPEVGDIITFNWDSDSQPNDEFADHIGLVESVSNGVITTIEGNSSNMVRRRTYNVGDGNIRGFARPKYSDTLNNEYTGGDLINAGNSISQKDIRKLINECKKYGYKPSFLIAQMFIESHWGNPDISTVGSVDNNWSGISEPFHAPESLGVQMSRGSARPSNEGGYYIHFNTLNDYFRAYAYILSNENGYNVQSAVTIEEYCRGLFRVGGASYDYAASGYDHYYGLLIPTYNEINRQNPGKLELIDSSSSGYDSIDYENPDINSTFGYRTSENGTFHATQTINICTAPSQNATIVGKYNYGEQFNYDSYIVNEGYIWLSYISYSGQRRYVAWRVHGGEKFGYIDDETSISSSDSYTRVTENGNFHPLQTINIRTAPSLTGVIVGQYKAGESFNYDSYVVNEGYIWLSYISYLGERRYVAWRVRGGEKFGYIDENFENVGNSENRVNENGIFHAMQTINIRTAPSLSAEIIGKYTIGESFHYDSYIVNENYIWLSYISYSGERRYVAWRVRNGEKFGYIE